MHFQRDLYWLTEVDWTLRLFLMYWYDNDREIFLLTYGIGVESSQVIFWQDLGAIANPMFKLKGPTMIQNNYSPAFPLKHQQKDMRLALAQGDAIAVSMPVAAAANEVILFYCLSFLCANICRSSFVNARYQLV